MTKRNDTTRWQQEHSNHENTATRRYNLTSGVAPCLCWFHSGKSAIHVYPRIRCRVLIGHWQSSVVFVVSKDLCHEKFLSRALAWNPLYVARDFQVVRSRARGSTTRILKRFWSSRICSVLKLGDFLGRSKPTSLSPNRSSKLFFASINDDVEDRME